MDMKRYFFSGYIQQNVYFLDIFENSKNNYRYIQKKIFQIYPEKDIIYKYIVDIFQKNISSWIFPWIYPLFGYLKRYFANISKISSYIGGYFFHIFQKTDLKGEFFGKYRNGYFGYIHNIHGYFGYEKI